MRWERFFEDLEDQLASEWDAERAALETESERLRLSRLELRERFRAMCEGAGADARVAVEAADGTVLTSVLSAVGADWIALDDGGTRSGGALVPLASVQAVGLREAALLRSARTAPAPARRSLIERMTLGFVLRDLARRRIALTVHQCRGRSLSGTIDRAGADHLDLALHDAAAPRRASSVSGFRMVPLTAIAWIRLDVAATIA